MRLCSILVPGVNKVVSSLNFLQAECDLIKLFLLSCLREARNSITMRYALSKSATLRLLGAPRPLYPAYDAYTFGQMGTHLPIRLKSTVKHHVFSNRT